MDTRRRRRCCATRSRPCGMRSPSGARVTRCTAPPCCSERPCRREGPSLARDDRLRALRGALLSFYLWLLAPGAWAQVTDDQARLKIAPDLLAAISASSPPALPWISPGSGDPLVKVLVASTSDDTTLADLRSFVLSL